MKRLLILVVLAVLGFAPSALAQCAGGLLPNCTPSTNLQTTDLVLVWQNGQNPHSRSATLADIQLSSVPWSAPPPIGNVTPNTGAFTTLSASSAVSGAGITALFASPPAIGGTAPAAGAFTTLSSTGNLTVAGTAITGFSNLITNSAIGKGLFLTSQGGLPALTVATGSRMIFSMPNAQASDYATLQVIRDTSFTGGGSVITRALGAESNIGANDANHNWNLGGICTTSSTAAGAFCLGGYLTGIRNAGATSSVWGAVLNAVDNTDLASSLNGGKQVVGVEVDSSANGADDGINGAMWGGHGNRIGVNVVAVRQTGADTAQTQIAYGVWATTSSNPFSGAADAHTNFMSVYGIGLNSQAYNVFDARGAAAPTGSSNPVLGLVMLAGQYAEFDGGAALDSGPARSVYYDSGLTALRYMINGAQGWRATDAGGFLVGSGSAIANNATGGFLHLPFSTGTPSGTPTTPNACEINTGTGTINCYIGGAWSHVTLTAGAG